MPIELDAETEALFAELIKLQDGENIRAEPGVFDYGDQRHQVPPINAPESPSKGALEKPSSASSTTAPIPPNTAPSTGIKTSTVTIEPYDFPIYDSSVVSKRENLRHMSNVQLLELLRKITYDKVSSTGDHAPYSRLRPIVCAVGLLLNELGQTAPRFRLIRKAKNFKSIDDITYSNDLQVLDLHWLSLYCKVSPEPQWKEIFGNSLSFKGASKFVARRGMAGDKATALGISPLTQLMLSVIKTKEVSDRWATIKAGRESAAASMQKIATKINSRFDVAAIPARCDEYVALRIGRGSPTVATEILPRIAGAPSTLGRMKKRKQWFTDNEIAVD